MSEAAASRARESLEALMALLLELDERLSSARERLAAYDATSSQAAADAVSGIKKTELFAGWFSIPRL